MRMLEMRGMARPCVYLETVQGVTIASFSDSALVDAEILDEVEAQLRRLADASKGAAVLLNSREVRLMSSAMLPVLLRFSRSLARNRGRLKLCGLAPHLREVFRLTRFDRIFDIQDEERIALDSF